MNRGQLWSMDFIIGFIIFIIAGVFAMDLLASTDTGEFDGIYNEGVQASQFLLGEGTPEDWNSTNFTTPGIAEQNRINLTKLEELDKIPYDDLRRGLLIENEFAFNFKNANITPCVYGSDDINYTRCAIDFDSIQADDLIIIRRYVLLKSEITEMKLYVWR